MKILGTVLLALQLMSLSNVQASTNDIKGARFELKTVRTNKDKITFILCDNKKIPALCEYIGKISGYTLKELDVVKQSELVEARWKTGGAVVVGIVGAFTGLAVGMSVTGAATSVTGYITATQSVQVTALAASGATTPLWFNRVNPFHQFDQADVLNHEGLLDQKIILATDEEVLEVSELLAEVLAE